MRIYAGNAGFLLIQMIDLVSMIRQKRGRLLYRYGCFAESSVISAEYGRKLRGVIGRADRKRHVRIIL